MRRFAVVLAALMLAGAVSGSASASSSGVLVAGHGSLAGGATASVAAFDFGGRIGGIMRVESAPGFVFVSRVTCIRVVESRVLVGGVIVRSPTPATLGNTSLIAIEDGGLADRDSLGLAFSNSGLDSCPVFALPMQPLAAGNFVVHGSG